MKKKITILLSAAVASMTAAAGSGLPEPDFVLPIEYTSEISSNGITEKEYTSEKGICYNITEAEIMVFLPETPKPENGYPCIVIFPGGGYANIHIRDAGIRAAEFYTANGLAAVVVKYRLPNGHPSIPVTDGQQAVRMVRMNASRFGINPEMTGITGSSAGGHLAAMLAVHTLNADPDSPHELDHYSSRPDFLILVKAVINDRNTWTLKKILGPDPDEESIEFCNPANHIDSTAMPTFISHCTDDPAAPVDGALEFYDKLKASGVPAEIHIFRTGKHGMGYIDNGKPMDIWKDIAVEWMKNMKIIGDPSRSGQKKGAQLQK